jgi:hypothetical protein
MNFQAAATAIAGIHLLAGVPLGWSPALCANAPVSVWSETSGPGDDIRVELADRSVVEVQAKRGLERSPHLWNSLEAMARAIAAEDIAAGVLLVSPSSSGTIREDLPRDISRLGGGRTDGLSNIGQEATRRITPLGLDLASTCRRLSVQVLDATTGEEADVRSAIVILRGLLREPDNAQKAWDLLLVAAHDIIEKRGRWDLATLSALLGSRNVAFGSGATPVEISEHLRAWTIETNQHFDIVGWPRPVLISKAWIALEAVRQNPLSIPDADAITALDLYRRNPRQGQASSDEMFDAQWLGRFRHPCVIVAGPALGKSTLLQNLARLYALDGMPVVKVSLRRVAAAMRQGKPFEDAAFEIGLEGSGADARRLAQANLQEWVLLADGLDETGPDQVVVRDALANYAAGHRRSRILVTTRPFGYVAGRLADWTHYNLLPLDEGNAAQNLAHFLHAMDDKGAGWSQRYEQASLALSNRITREAIGRSPGLLGMAAGILAVGGSLGASRTDLYRRLYDILAARANPRVTDLPRPVVRKFFLEFLSWTLAEQPLASLTEVIRKCGEALSRELGLPRLRGEEEAEHCLNYWEGIGAIERLHHPSINLLAFAHKTLGEFLAATYLATRLSSEQQGPKVRELVGQSTWAEVLRFAAGLGLGEAIVTATLDRAESDHEDSVRWILEMLADPCVEVSRSTGERAIALALRATSGEDYVDDTGELLVDLASSRPDLVVSTCSDLVDAEHVPTRIVAWAAVAKTDTRVLDGDAAGRAVIEMLPRVGWGIVRSRFGGSELVSDHGGRLLVEIAVAAVKALLSSGDAAGATALADRLIGERRFQEPQVIERLAELLASKGWVPSIDPTADRPWLHHYGRDVNFTIAERKAQRAVMRALSSGRRSTSTQTVDSEAYVNLRALRATLDWYHFRAADDTTPAVPYDEEVIFEIVKGAVAASGLNPTILAGEADSLLASDDARPDTDLLGLIASSSSLDVPAPDWSRVQDIGLDVAKLEAGLSHPSLWIVEGASNALEAIGNVAEEKIADWLDHLEGWGLAAAALFTYSLGVDRAVPLLLRRLLGTPTQGVSFLLRVLDRCEPRWTDDIGKVVETALLGHSRRLANAAADLALGVARRGETLPGQCLRDALAIWRKRDSVPREPRSWPSSPYESLIEALVVSGHATIEDLMSWSSDVHTGISHPGEKKLLARVHADADARQALVQALADKTTDPRLLNTIIRQRLPFTAEEIAGLETLLLDPEPHWRCAAVSLLQTTYIDAHVIRIHISRLEKDPTEEVRQRILGLVTRA